AETWEEDKSAPPIGGMGAPYSFGRGTPTVIVCVMAAKLPSPHSHLPLVRSGPRGEPLASVPWQPAHGALATPPWKMLLPSVTSSRVAPGGTGGAPPACERASGWTPSGGTAAPGAELSAREDGAGAAAMAAVAGPRYVTRQIRPRWSS